MPAASASASEEQRPELAAPEERAQDHLVQASSGEPNDQTPAPIQPSAQDEPSVEVRTASEPAPDVTPAATTSETETAAYVAERLRAKLGTPGLEP